MQWSQIKTLFILCFLVLNIYLFIEFYDKQRQSDGVIEQRVDSTIEEQLEQENIKIPKLPEETESKEPFITVEQKLFTEEDLKQLEELQDRSYEVINDKLIVSLFDQAISVPAKASIETITELVQSTIPYTDQYTFWDWNEDLNILVFFQQKKDRPIYYNQNGLLLIFLDDNNEMVFYSQSMLGEEEERQEKRTLISPIMAIETLYNAHELSYGDEVNKVEPGFHTRIPSTNGVQVFVPTWKITVNNTKNYFVNAIEGFVFSSNENEFLEETLTIDLSRIQSSLVDKHKIKKEVVDHYKEKLELINQGGE